MSLRYLICRSLRRLMLATTVLLVAAIVCPVACAVDTPLYERQPFDLVIVRDEGKSTPLEVLPLKDRTPGAARSGDLYARLLDAPGEEIAIPGPSVERVELYEEQLLSKAKEFAAKSDFNSAYPYFAKLERDYPDYPGLTEAFTKAIYDEARALFAAKEYDHALALLGSLKERSSRTPGLENAVDTIGDAILKARWEAEDYLGVRRTVDAIEGQFAGMRLSLGERWLGRMSEGAALERAKAQRLAAAGKGREALRIVSGAVALDPTSQKTRQLLAELSSAGGTLWVGVWETAAPDATPDLDSPAAVRQSRLIGGRLATLESFQPSGGEYVSTAGVLDTDDARRQLSIRFADSAMAYRLARLLLEPAGAAREPLALLRERTAAVSVEGDNRLLVDLKSPHPQPMALAAAPLNASQRDIAPGEWRRVSLPAGSEAAARYERVSGAGAFGAVEEYVYSDIDEAFADLRARQIHALMGVPPWRVAEVEALPTIELAELRLPTLHCLLLHPSSSLRERREVRRAIRYGIASQETLNKIVLGEAQRNGFEVLSNAVPRGKSLGDPLRYAYNESIEPRPYEPRLAALLLAAARAADAEAAEAGLTIRAVPTSLTIAHPPTPVARAAVAAIRDQLAAVGLEIELREASEEELSSGGLGYDLRYAEITMGEPLTDVWRLYGPGGVSGGCSPAMRDALDKVVGATDVKAAVNALRDLHRVVYADLPLIPLWQTVEYAAYQSNLAGVAAEPIDLYQTIDDWRITDGGAR
ncbi:ABC transporter substrate-binding protein [Botrimarina mediterranea]|nr:ABC transporter substrate-binding protein [Botrimarina mediterranea]